MVKMRENKSRGMKGKQNQECSHYSGWSKVLCQVWAALHEFHRSKSKAHQMCDLFQQLKMLSSEQQSFPAQCT